MQNQKGNTLLIGIVIGVLIAGILGGSYYFLKLKNDQPIQNPVVNNTPPDSVPGPAVKTTDYIAVKVVNGDIVVTKNGNDTKITEWGYNSGPILSPDSSKVAYLSKTKESLENEKKYQNYVPTSDNVWIINTDGSEAIQVTQHDNWVYRNNLLWLDENRLLFTDGESSAKVYSVRDKTLTNVLGPEKPEGACVDACGSSSKFIYSPDKNYLLLLADEGYGGVAVPPKSTVLNTQTLKSLIINDKFIGVNFDVAFDTGKKSVSFEAYRDINSGEIVRITINLETGQVVR